MEIQRLSSSAPKPAISTKGATSTNADSIDLEHKAVAHMGSDGAAGIERLMSAFAAFREVNDERISQLERRSASDAVTEDKLVKINNELDACQSRLETMAVHSQRPHLGGPRDSAGLQRKAAFDAYVRSGDASAYTSLQTKGMTTDPGTSGGYSVPVDLETEIGRVLGNISPIRSIASVKQTSMGSYKKPFATQGFVAGWAAESATRSQSADPNITELVYPAMELYAMPAASNTLLEDTAVDLEAWVVDEVQQSFSEQENSAFVNGNGTARPRGFLNYPVVSNSSWTWGSLGTVPSRGAGAYASSNPQDALIDLTHAVRAGYRSNGTFVMNRSTLAATRKLKDADGRYLWQPASRPGEASSLMGFSVVECEDMPDIAAGSTSVAFGDFRRGYLVVDRRGTTVLRDPFTAKPWILFYVTKRVGGGVQDFDAIKLLKFSVS